MKAFLLFAFILLSAIAHGQNELAKTNSLLTWLIQKDHITHLKRKSNAGVFYDTTYLKKQSLVDESLKSIPNLCIKDMLSIGEVEIFKTVPRMLMQTDWKKKYPKLKVKFVTDDYVEYKEIQNDSFIVYTFSEPLFLNKDNSRVLIGESFICGMVCGRIDLLLCESKNGNWQLLGRAVVENE
jgi:hypothetical protein